ncbi:CaiB/BaiF CoA transferase family protein [Aurantivibrio plasticivorans]
MSDTGKPQATPLPLQGVKVLDLSRFLPAGYATMILADYGADVIRVEQPNEVAKQNKVFGRDHLSTEALRAIKEQEMLARNKRSLCINLRDAQARSALQQMIAGSDVLIHDYRQENAKAMGLDYASVKQQFPSLIHVEVSVCGQSGPYQSLAGHDPIALALSGALSRLGGELADFNIPGMPVGDLATGLHTVIGIMAALRSRDATGHGQLVDVAMSDCALSMMTSVMQRYLMEGKAPPKSWRGANIGLWNTKDGKVLCTTDLEPAYWRKFCTAVGREDLAPLQFAQGGDAEFRDAELTQVFASRSRDEWFALLREAGTQVAPAYELADALLDEHAIARGTVVSVPGSDGQLTQQIGPAVKLSTSPGTIRHLGRVPGADNQAVLEEFGFSEEEITELLS